MAFNLQNLALDKLFESNDSYASGAQVGYAELILAKFKANKAVRQNRIFDYVFAETDPNFSLNSRVNSTRLETLLSKLSLSTSLVTMANAKLSMLQLTEFIPSNIRYLMENFQAVADTGVNSLSSIKQLISFTQIEKAFLADLKLQFSFGTITYQDVMTIANNVLTNFPSQESTENVSIRSLLSLGIQSVFPDQLTELFETLQWIDIVDSVIGEGFETEKNLFEQLFSDSVSEMSKVSTPISAVVPPGLSTQTYYLDLQDPLGTSIQSTVSTETISWINTELKNKLDSKLVSNPLPFTADQIQQIYTETFVTFIEPQLKQNLNSVLPSISEIVDGLNTDTYNKTVNSINSAFQTFALDLMKDTEVVYITSETVEKPLDYLFNVRRNLKSRIDLTKTGSPSEAFVELDNYLKTVFGKSTVDTLSAAELERLNTLMKTVLKEKDGTA